MTEAALRLGSALEAARWLGTKEGRAGHRQILSCYNAIRPLPRGYTMKEKDPWCAAFVSAAAVMAGLEALYPLECGCGSIIEKAKNMGIWVEDDKHIPEAGDWVLYNWQADAAGDDRGSPDHVGIVIGADAQWIQVVEGNYDNAVKLRRLAVNDRTIRGFVCPDFGSAAGERRFHTIDQVPEYARATIGKLAANGSLRGFSEDDLGLTEDLVRTLVILDRQGLFRA